MEYSQGDIDIELIDRLHSSPVSRMFHERSVFITGASGFIGRVLLEKLLRTYPTIKRVYLLMRPKRNQKPSERLYKQLLNAPVFDKIRAMPNCAELFSKLEVITGDIAKPNLGISEEEMQMMLDDPSLGIVFHSAATIKFDEPLKVSVNLNLIATRTIIDICKKLPNLVSLCHVSTAHVNSNIKDGRPIEEEVYPMRDDYDKLIKMAEVMDENLMQHLKLTLVDQRPNTYTYTKALAEQLVINEASDLPVSIVRPSIVVASWREPFAGWIDNLNGPTGLMLAVAKGLLRNMCGNTEVKSDLVPVDVVVNTMIAAAYYAADKHTKQINTCKETAICEPKLSVTTTPPVPAGVPIFHCNSGDLNPQTWGQHLDKVESMVQKYPSGQVMRYPRITFCVNKWHDLFVRLFAHFLPALIIDLICGLMGKKRRMMGIYHKLHAATSALTHFCSTTYNFKTKNIKLLEQSLSDIDRHELFMNIGQMNWHLFWDNYMLGGRRYLLKESDQTLRDARCSLAKALYVEKLLKNLVSFLVLLCTLPLVLRSLSTGGILCNTLQAINVY